MNNQDAAVISAVFMTGLITSLAWGLIWAIATISRLKDEKNEHK